MCCFQVEMVENRNLCEDCCVDVNCCEKQLPTACKAAYRALRNNVADRNPWRLFIAEWREVVGPARGRGVPRSGKFDFEKRFEETRSGKHTKDGRRGRFMNQAGMVRFYETEKGWARDKAERLWQQWLSQGRQIVPDEDDGQPMMWVLTEIYGDQSKFFQSADVVQAGAKDAKNVAREAVEEHIADLQDGGQGLTGSSLENVEKRFGKDGSAYSPIKSDNSGEGINFSALLTKAPNMLTCIVIDHVYVYTKVYQH